MITGERRVKINTENILVKISEYDIFMRYMPSNIPWKLDSITSSPFRKDNNPSFIIGNREGRLYFKDFAVADLRGDAFDFVQKLYGISVFQDVLRKIDSDFGLGFNSDKNIDVYKKIVSQYKQPETSGKRHSLIQVITRKFNKEELDYWAEYHQGIEDLRTNKIYSIKEVFLNRKRFNISKDELRFGYLYEGGYWKIYRPFQTKKRKWMSSVPIHIAYGLENLRSDKNALICKSLKDYLVCIKVYPYTCHVQNESVAAFSDETVSYIKSNSLKAFYGGDSDDQGKDASHTITKAFDFLHINTPDRLLPEVNDFAGWGRLEGLSALREHFIDKKLMDDSN